MQKVHGDVLEIQAPVHIGQDNVGEALLFAQFVTSVAEL
jgi:hypothetical protein